MSYLQTLCSTSRSWGPSAAGRWGMVWGVTLSQGKPTLQLPKLVPVPSSFKVVMILMEPLKSRTIGDFHDMRDSWLALCYQAKVDFFWTTKGKFKLESSVRIKGKGGIMEEILISCPELHPCSCGTRLCTVVSTPTWPPVFPCVSPCFWGF